MRLPLKASDYLCTRVNPSFENIEKSYLKAITPAVEMRSVNAMLGDGTVTQTNTFDPANVRSFYENISKGLSELGWAHSDVASSETEDLHRMFVHLSKVVGKYHLSGYFGVQFHALPYYKVDKRVIEVQNELSLIAEKAGTVFGQMTGAADKALRIELEKRGYADMEFQELFTKMFDDEKLAQELDRKSSDVERNFPEFEEMGKKKTELFAELNDLLVYLHQTSNVSIDHNKQMQGEEGVTTYFDLEVIRNKKTMAREAYVDSAIVTAEWADKLANELDAVAALLKNTS